MIDRIKIDQVKLLIKKIRRGAACCAPRYRCNVCPYRADANCYGKLIANITYCAETFLEYFEKDCVTNTEER